MRRDGIDLSKAQALLNRRTRAVMRPKQIKQAGRHPVPVSGIIADYRSLNLDDIGELLLALHQQSALSDGGYALLVESLSAARMRCTAALRAAAMGDLTRKLLAQLPAQYRPFMQTALAPLESPGSPGLTQLPSCPASGS
jgi:hypothetical protein